ncbi:MAG: nicotinate phosphoribosyltransferase [Streptococcaceae bacterium]|jgi:nicotinamide phosphoribosyltransferase|nr:nicotinate phosphoribosyltransferase [Streptococcaceae bacterium]
MSENLILSTDAYKLTHWQEYPKGLSKLYSYCEARTGGRFDEICFFGLQMVINDHFLTPVTTEMIDEAEEAAYLTFGTRAYFNREVWEKVRDLGYLPIKIKALPEGSVVPTGTALFTIESTEPWFATTMNALETLLMHVWYPTTIATNELFLKRDLLAFYEKTGDVENLPFAVNDFGLRGVTSLMAGERGGSAHLLHFLGTDNMAANRAIERIYGEKGRGKSVWATEHSVATSYGEGDGEANYLNAQLDLSDSETTISIVIDSFETLHFIDAIVGRADILEKIRKRSGRVVLRPDSGNPIETPIAVIEHLDTLFGHTRNAKGYKVLADNVGVIQGDGMKRETIVELYQTLTDLGWSADNLVTGSGGGLLQESFDRDTERFAIKASYAELSDGTLLNVHKKTPGKVSKSGRLKVVSADKGIQTVSESAPGDDLLETVYENGKFTVQSFGEIVARAESGVSGGLRAR